MSIFENRQVYENVIISSTGHEESQVMKNRELNIQYTEYSSVDEMDSADRELTLAAIEAMKGSYAPYSHFNVGAAVRLDNGNIVTGANQENNAYPSGLCAERVALFHAGAIHPAVGVSALAVTGGPDCVPMNEPASPCGACRQVMAEYQRRSGHPMKVILYGQDRVLVFQNVDSLLPFIFDSLLPE